MSHKLKYKNGKIWVKVGIYIAVSFIITLFVANIPIRQHALAKTGDKSIIEPQNLYAKAAVLMDGDSGRILFEKNGREALPNASTTKLLTCILALENGNTEDIVTASPMRHQCPRWQSALRRENSII